MVYNDLKKGEKFLGILFFSLQLGFLSQDNQREFVARMHVRYLPVTVFMASGTSEIKQTLSKTIIHLFL